MKKKVVILTCMLLLVLLAGCSSTNNKKAEETSNEITPTEVPATPTPEPVITYKDGIYEVETDADYEGYQTKAVLTIENGSITAVDWTIYDTERENRPFDETYEEVFEGNETFIKQSRNDWNGSREYSSILIEKQDLDEVDAVSGATWTNRKFKQVVQLALDEAAEN